MEKLVKFTRTSVGRVTIGFVGTATVLLGTPLFSPEASATVLAGAQQAQRVTTI